MKEITRSRRARSSLLEQLPDIIVQSNLRAQRLTETKCRFREMNGQLLAVRANRRNKSSKMPESPEIGHAACNPAYFCPVSGSIEQLTIIC